jgi:DNA-binding LacI/PurR family transcriptional regulator
LAQGYRRIAFLGDRALPEVAQRYAGYRAELADQQIAVDEALYECSGFRADHALQAMERLLARKVDFDAIVAASDVIAVSAIHALTACGRSIPDDVGVVGFDDIQLAQYNNPSVTSVAQDIATGARHLVHGITEMIAGREVSSVEMPCHLVVRQSSGPRGKSGRS